MAERTFDRTVTIRRDPGRVFGFLADPERAGAWMPEIVRVEVLDDGPVRAGTRYRETRKVAGREVAAEITISDLQTGGGRPPFSITHTSAAMGCTATYRFTVDAAGGDADAARVDLHAVVASNGLLSNLFSSRLIFAAMRKSDGDVLERLRDHLESDAADLPEGPPAA